MKGFVLAIIAVVMLISCAPFATACGNDYGSGSPAFSLVDVQPLQTQYVQSVETFPVYQPIFQPLILRNSVYGRSANIVIGGHHHHGGLNLRIH